MKESRKVDMRMKTGYAKNSLRIKCMGSMMMIVFDFNICDFVIKYCDYAAECNAL